MILRDTDGRAVSYITFSLDAGGETAPFTLNASPQPGETLRASGDVALAAVFARLPGGGWVDLAGGLFLGTYAGGTVGIDFKAVAAPDVVGRVRAILIVGAPQGGAAGWLT
jgi:hypothetical protein